MPEDLQRHLRALPKVDRVAGLLAGPHAIAVEAARRAIEEARATILASGQAVAEEVVMQRAEALVIEVGERRLQAVVNASGVLIHTNLGRVPLGGGQLAAVARISGSYSNLEYDLGIGRRGSRYEHATDLIRAVTGADAAIVVNNNAAAVLLACTALAADREIVVSRGELVEIGGEFRIPDVVASSKARLVEVGTTNRTHLRDYESAIGPDTAMILKVHPSNYRVVGFTHSVASRELAGLAKDRGICFVHDLGSGLVSRSLGTLARDEPHVADALSEGATLVTFSGDKLLGGPQAGVIAGERKAVEALGAHPLMRALRVDKMALAALEATLVSYLEGREEDIPLWRMVTASPDDLEERAGNVVARLGSSHELKAEVVPTRSVLGGGSLPGEELPSWGISLVHETLSPDAIAGRLRSHDPPVIARIEEDRVMLDLRGVDPSEIDTVTKAIVALAGPSPL